MSNQMPYKVSYSLGQQNCRRCSQIIELNQLQIAIMMQSDEDDCHYPEWYHQICFFQTRLPNSEALFDGFALLRYTDQLSLKRDLGLIDIDVESPMPKAKLPDFSIEYTRLCRDPCTACKAAFLKGEIRIMKVVYENKDETSFGKATWYHVYCFAYIRNEIGWMQSAESLPGFSRLAEEDKESLLIQIPMIKREIEKEPVNIDVDLVELEKSIAAQNKEYYNVYDTIVNCITYDDQVQFLQINLQFIPNTSIEIAHQLADMLCFGALQLCAKCTQGQMKFCNSVYVCTNVSNWDKCDYSTKDPQRFLPALISRVNSPTTNFPLEILPTAVRKRELHCFRLTDENGVDLVNAPYVQPPLFNMEFVIVGNLEKPRNEIEKQIRKLGGKIGTTIHSKLAAVISNHIEIKNMGFQMESAKRHKIQVVSVDFLAAIQTTDPIAYIISESLDDGWGGDPYERIEQNNVRARRSSVSYTQSVPKRVTYKCKNGTAVDPDSGLDDEAHVYCVPKDGSLLKYSVVLALVDIENDKNTYYRIQLLQSDDMKTYWVFESWGRISTVIGSKKLTSYFTLELAREYFEAVYKEKTANRFGVKRFLKRPNKFYHIDIDFGDLKYVRPFAASNLCPTVHQLMQLIFDTKKVEDMMMLGCDLDLSQMPLGKIGAAQILRSMNILQEISKFIRRNGTMGQLREASNKFYTMIPHAFGVKRPPIIDSIDVVKTKYEMLERLHNMELVYEFLIDGNGIKTNPLDACYLKMKTEITTLDKNSPEFQHFYHMVRDSHGPTHKTFVLEVLEAFKIHRAEDEMRFKRYENLPNHQLLWHGSRLTNFVNILTNGLRVAPPDAIHTGYMFGKGIYFADIISKSANYCFADFDSAGLLMLCEVALGTSRTLVRAENVIGIPNDVHQSVMGMGMYHSILKRTIDGIPVAAGSIQPSNQRTVLLYNEYIVYDPAQVKIKYLFKIKFHKRLPLFK